MPTLDEIRAQLSARRALQPVWKTKKDQYLDDTGYFPSDGSRNVLSVRVVVNEVFGRPASGQADTKPQPQVPMAHFRIFLVLDESPETPASVELNSMGMTTAGDTRLSVISHNWVISSGRAQKFADRNIPPVQGRVLTVDNILDLLINNKRHHYRLHASGSGCRYWTRVVLRDLIGVGYLAPEADGVVNAIMADISRVRPDVLMLAHAEGTFF